MDLTYELHIFSKEKYIYEYNSGGSSANADRERGVYVVYDKLTGNEFNTYNDDFVYVADNMKNRFGDYTIPSFARSPTVPEEVPLTQIDEVRGFKEYETPLPGEFNYASDVFVIITGH